MSCWYKYYRRGLQASQLNSHISLRRKQEPTFISQHESNGHQSVLAALLSPDTVIEILQAVDEQKRQ
jgi:hypothetical protein